MQSDRNHLLSDPDYGRDVLSRLNSFRSTATFTDAVLCVGQEEFPCHRNVLAVSSPYFRAMFTCGLREGRDAHVLINDISPWTLKRVIEYAYSGKLLITPENAQEMLTAGSLFEYPAIVDASCQFLRQQLHASNGLGIERFAHLHSCKQLQADANKFVLENFSSVVEYDEFLDLSVDRLVSYISSDFIDVRNEETVYDAVMRWLRYDLDDRQKCLSKLLLHVRLPIVELNYLNAIETDPLIQKRKDCLEIVQAAQRHHESIIDQQGKRRRSMQTHQVHPRPSTVAKEVLVVIGGINNYITRSVEMYDPQKDKWTPLSDFPEPVSQYSVAGLTNTLVVTGGINDGHIVNSTWKFDTPKRLWTKLVCMSKPRARHASAALNGRVYVLGGVTYDSGGDTVDLDSIECYDPTSNTWQIVGCCAFPRQLSRVVPYKDTLLEVGGLQNNAKVKTIDSYLCTDAFVKPTGEQYVLPDPIQHSQILVMDGIFYIIWEDTRKVLALNPEKRTFRNLPDTGHNHVHSGAAVLNHKIYIVGGLSGSDNHKPTKIVECYDVSTNTWSEEKRMNESRACHGCVVVQM